MNCSTETYRVEDRIKQYSDTARLWQNQIAETDPNRSQIETAISVCKHLDLGTLRPGLILPAVPFRTDSTLRCTNVQPPV